MDRADKPRADVIWEKAAHAPGGAELRERTEDRRRDEIRRDETRRDETRRDETRRDETRRDETRRDDRDDEGKLNTMN